MSCVSSLLSCEFCRQDLSTWSAERQVLHRESCIERAIIHCRQCPACYRPLNFDVSKSHLSECSRKLGLSIGQLLSLDSSTGSERTVSKLRPKGKKASNKRLAGDSQNSFSSSQPLKASSGLSRKEISVASKAALLSTLHLCVGKPKRLEILSARLSSVLLADSLSACILQRDRKTTAYEKRGLWALSSNFNEDHKLAFYVSTLVPPLVPCYCKIGDNLRRFSQIPGNSASGKALDLSLTQEQLIRADKSIMLPICQPANHDPVVVTQSSVSPCPKTVGLAPLSPISITTACLADQNHASPSRKSNSVPPSTSAPTTAGIFTQMVGSPLCADLSICLDSGELVPAHRFVFAAWNPDLAIVQEKDVSISAPGISKKQLVHLLTALYTNDVAAFASLEPEEEFVLDCWQLLDIVRPFSHSLLSSQPSRPSPSFKVPFGGSKRLSTEPTALNHSAVFSDANSVAFPAWTSPTPSKVLSSPSRVNGATYSGDLFAASDDSILTVDLPLREDKVQISGTVNAVSTPCPGPGPSETCSSDLPQTAFDRCPTPPKFVLPDTHAGACASAAPTEPSDHLRLPSLCDGVRSPLPIAEPSPPSFTPSPPIPSPPNDDFQPAWTVIPPTPQEPRRLTSPETTFSGSDPPAYQVSQFGAERIPSPPSSLPLDMSCFFDASVPAPLAKRLRMTEEANSQSTISPERHSAPSSPVRQPNRFSPSEHHADRIDFDSEEGDMSSSQPVLSSRTPLKRPAHGRPSASVISFSPITPKPAYEQMPTPHLRKALSEYGLRNLPKKKAIRILNHIYDELHPYVEVPSVVMEGVSQVSPAHTSSITPLPDRSPGVDKENAAPTMSQSDINGPSVENESAGNFASSTPANPNLGPLNGLLGKTRKCVEKTQNAEIQQRVYEFLRMNNDIYYNIVTYTPLELDCLHALLRDAGLKLGLNRLMSMLDEWGVTFTTKNNRKPSKPKCSRPAPRY